ncbi:MAG: DUF4339 domain-containing protein [Myxococcales bacterium]|nr:DUF4339 domain-containing protein [Myxococcales bacterium]
MKISCPACNAHYRLPDDKIQGKNRIFKIACKRCGAEIRVRGVETPEEVGRTTLPFALDLPEQATAAQPPAQIWFAGIGGRQIGPLSEAEVIDHIASGRLTAEDPVWRKGFSAWTPCKDVPPFDDHVAVAPDVPTDAAAPAARKLSPRRAQTLELSAAMIELLVKLDGQQAPDSEGVAQAAEPPELPPLDAAFAAKPRSPAQSPTPAAAVAVADQVDTTISPFGATGEPIATVKAAMIASRTSTAPALSNVSDLAPPIDVGPARVQGTAPIGEAKRVSQPALPKAAEAGGGSIRIRLPDEQVASKDRRGNIDANKVALPGQAARGDAKTANRPDGKSGRADLKIGSGMPAIAPIVSGPVGAAARAANVAANAAGVTQPGSRIGAPPSQKSGGGAMIGIVLSVVFAAAAVTVFLALSGKTDKPADTAAMAASAAPAAVAAGPTVAPALTAVSVPVVVKPAVAPDAQAAPSEDAAAAAPPAAVDPQAVAAVAKVDEEAAKAAADKASADRASADKASADKASADKASADKASADKASADKTSADKASADKASAEKASAEKASADKAASEKSGTDRAAAAVAAEKAAANKAASDQANAEKAAAAKAKAEENKAKAAEEREKSAASRAAKADTDKQAKAEKAASDASKREQDKADREEKAKKANADKASKDQDKAAARDKAAESRKAVEEKAKADKESAGFAKAKAAADKKAIEEAKRSAEEATKAGKGKKSVSDDDVEELLRKHAKGKDGGEGEDANLTPAQIKEYGNKAGKNVVNCYLLHADDQGEDTIKVTALVGSTGGVERATVMGKHGNNRAMAGCIGDAVRKIGFPPSGGAAKKYVLQYRVGG